MTLWDLLDKRPGWTPIFVIALLMLAALLSPNRKEPPK